MNIAELLADDAKRAAEFPVTRDKVFLAHAGVCPLPARVSRAIQEYAQLSTEGDQEILLPLFRLRETRAWAAQLLRAQPEEIAFMGPTSLGLSCVAAGIEWRAGENVIVYLEDYPSNVYPWMALRAKGVELRFLRPRELGAITLADIEPLTDASTRLVALASSHYISGFRPDLNEIGAFLRSRDILLCVDGIQTVGAFPTPVEQVDFLAADAHKWMLGPCGAGILFVRKELQDTFQPPLYGWNNVRSPDFIAQEELVLRPDARRYEPGTHNLLGLVGLHAALGLLVETGLEAIAQELLRKRERLVAGLERRGCVVLQMESPPARQSGIVSFSKPGMELAALHERLTGSGLVTSLRATRDGRSFLRLSPHFYNTDAELERLLEQI